jgi:serine/threonine-protein kinase
MLSLPQPPLSKPGSITLGRYEVLGAVARGGMGSVYLARHSGEAGFKRLYAIKVLHPHLSDDTTFVQMLLDEARIAASLHHPNVVPVVDLGAQDGSHYIVMEYIEGCSLSVLLAKDRNVRLPRLIVPIVLDALAGLHAAHSLNDEDGTSMGLVHRDVSPQNILVGVDGSARITDFGIAKASSKISSTMPGQLKGKLAYMAPEQVANPAGVDARTDVFAAGALLWSALTGRRLFLGATDAETLNNVQTLVVPPPSTVGFLPPAALDAVVLRALERDPARRFQSAAEMEDALRTAAQAAGALGTKREVADWLASRFGEELAERRAIVRGADSVPNAATLMSGLRKVGSGLTPTEHAALQASSTPAAPGAAAEPAPGKAGRKTLLAIGIGVGVALLAVVGVLAARSAPSKTALASAPLATVAPPGAISTAAPSPVTAAPSPVTAAPSPVTAATTAPSSAAALPAKVTPVAVRPSARWVPAAAPVAAETAKKKTWDSESPLPPQ